MSACTGEVEVNHEEPFKTACQEYFLYGIEDGEFLNEYKPEIVDRCNCLYTSFDENLEDENIVFLTDSFKSKDPEVMQKQLTEKFGEEKFDSIGNMIMACQNP